MNPSDRPNDNERLRDPAEWKSRSVDKYWRRRVLEYRPDPDFFEIADPIVASRRTLLGYDRLYVLWQAIRNVATIDGDAAEIGTYRGGSAWFIAAAFVSLTGNEVAMHVFDTFEGHPAAGVSEHDPFQTAGNFDRTSLERVRAYLAPYQRLQLHPGDVSASLPRLAESTYRLVHVDSDLYQPTKVCLDYFGRRMAGGGVIVIDDYASKKCPGVPKAVSEYGDALDMFQVWDMRTDQLILVKR